ncbi:NAD-dependent epimerase/dehydratase family protein [Nitrosarchaeum koreense]|uniref:Putative NAD dependent epimerase/dehydratase family protein n=1 Tax=Nitrosarchaeum koreense MY1 TaxID=1001994 RepID=F9CY68_9ARCH|nr:NAD-dependent epimerase/dehydratase family protein [Nitrosarchaeum koreense]EGP92846.1 Putative NAD dependent epimerase/dehydratase family protein [Nitrosarchaeum koreense MY1]
MKFAVIGGAGFIGNNIVRQLLKQNHTPVVIDSLYRGKIDRISSLDVEFHKIDIRDFGQLRDIIKNFDGIFHEAALTDVQESFTKQQEYNDVNVKGTENIFRIAKEFNLKVVYASSSSVYGNPKKIPIQENSERNPINPYGKTKLDDEFLAEKYSKDNVSIIGLRYFNVYGEGQTGSYAGVITKFLNRLKEKKSPIIFGTGTQLRDFIFVEDVARANIAAMQSNVNNGFFNIGTGITTSIEHLAKIMIELSGLKLEIQYENALDGDVQSSQADTNLTESVLKWKYSMELKNGLSKFFI